MLYALTDAGEPGGKILHYPLNERHVRRILQVRVTLPEQSLDHADLTPFGVFQVPYIEPDNTRRWRLGDPEWTAKGTLRRTYIYEDTP